MTITESPLNVDYSQKNATAPLLPHPPLLTSYQSGWQGIQLAHHRQPAVELPELSGAQHIIGIPAARHSVTVEFVSEGRLQPFQYHPSDYLTQVASYSARSPWNAALLTRAILPNIFGNIQVLHPSNSAQKNSKNVF